MKKKLVFLLTISLSCLSLWGCGGKQATEEQGVIAEPIEEVEEIEETIEEDALDELVEKMNAEEEESPEEEPVSEEENLLTDGGEVFNNGGNFVKIGDCIYYIKLTDNAVNKTVLFGNFRGNKMIGQECALMCYDTRSGQLEEIATVLSDTRLAYYDGCIYTGDYRTDYVWETWKVNLTTGEKEVFQYARLLCIDPETGRIVTIDSDENGSYLNVYGGEKLLYTLCVEDPTINVGEVSLQKEYLIYELQEQVDSDDGTMYLNKLCAANIVSDEGHFLGVLPEREDPTYPMYGAVDQLTVFEDRLYVAYGYYAGTGNFLNEKHVCVADPNQDDSLEEIEPTDAYDLETDNFLTTCLPEIIYCVAKPYDVLLNYDTYCLELFLPNSDGTLTAKSLAKIDGLEYDSENRKLAEVTEYVDGKVYLVIDEVTYNPDESIGWRDAYDVNAIHYYEMDVESGEMQELEPTSEF